MEKRGYEVFLVCAAGAGIGALVALWAGFLWPIGLVVGALIGYFAVEWREVPAGAKRAFRRTVAELDSLGFNRHRVADWLRRFRHTSVGALVTAPWIAAFVLLMFSPGIISGAEKIPMFLLLLATTVSSVTVFMGIFMAFSPITTEAEKVKLDLIKNNLFAVCFRYLPLGIWFCLVRIFPAIGWFLRFGGLFLRYLFHEIHSRLRVLCATYAACGAFAGYLAGNPLIGALVGGLLGLTAYKLLFARIYHRAVSV